MIHPSTLKRLDDFVECLPDEAASIGRHLPPLWDDNDTSDHFHLKMVKAALSNIRRDVQRIEDDLVAPNP